MGLLKSMHNDLSIKINIRIVLFDIAGVIFPHNQNTDEESTLIKFLDLVKKLESLDIATGIVSSGDNLKFIDSLRNNGFTKIANFSLDKISAAQKLLEESDFTFNEAAFIGDDIFDIGLLQKVGFSLAPSNARREVKRVVHHVVDNDETNFFDKVFEIVAKRVNVIRF